MRFLRLGDTERVFPYTKTLAMRKDMYPIDTLEAARILNLVLPEPEDAVVEEGIPTKLKGKKK